MAYDLTFAEIGKERREELLGAIRAIMDEAGAHGAADFDEAWWRWQYEALPTGQTRVYAALSDGQVLAYYHVPLYRGVVDGEENTFAMVQGVAVSRKLRGQGVFRRLAEYATTCLEDDPAVDLAYTFPNDKSIHTFRKYNGYAHASTLRVRVLPVDGARVLQKRLGVRSAERAIGNGITRAFDALAKPLRPSERLCQYEEIGAEIADVFAAHQQTFAAHLLRDEAYLHWRFLERPVGRHFVFAIEDDSGEGEPGTRAVAIFKLDEMLGAPAFVLMDFAHQPGHQGALLRLLSAVRRRAHQYAGQAVGLMITGGVDPFFEELFRIGFVPVPERFNPRSVHLLARSLRPGLGRRFPSALAWRATLADWDVL